MATRAGVRCPGCGTPESTIHVAQQLLRFEGTDEQVASHNYAVCADCHATQMKEFYDEENPRTWTLSKIPRAEV